MRNTKKYIGWLGRTLAIILTLVLLAGGLAGCFNKNNDKNGGGNGGTSGSIARGESVSVKNSKIELNDGAYLDFGANTVGDGTATVYLLKPTKTQEPEDAISAFYELEINPECNEPVTFKIPVDESKAYAKTPNTEVFYAIGSIFTDENGNEYAINSYIPVEISGGIATVSFVPSNFMQNGVVMTAGGSGKVTPTATRTRGVIRFLETETKDNRFKLHHSQGLKLTQDDLKLIIDDLNEAYDFYDGKGYKYDRRDKDNWPLDVFIEDTGAALGAYNATWAQRVAIRFSGNYANGSIYLSNKHINQHYERNVMKPVIYHEFFHFVQANYMHKTDKGLEFKKDLWLTEAVPTYYEWLISGVCPKETVQSNFERLYEGVFPPAEAKTDMTLANDHGYARAALIKFLAEENGEDFVFNTYDSDPATWDAYNSKIEEETYKVGAYAVDFYKALLSNRLGVFADVSSINNPRYTGPLSIMLNFDGKKPKADEKNVSINAFGAQMVGLNANAVKDDKNFTSEYVPIITVTGTDKEWFVLAANNKDKTAKIITPIDGKVTLNNFYSDAKEDIHYFVAVVGLHGSGKADHTVKILNESVTITPKEANLEIKKGQTEVEHTALKAVATPDDTYDFEWNFGNGTATDKGKKSSEPKPKYTEAGEYEITVTLKKDGKEIAKDTAKVKVTKQENDPAVSDPLAGLQGKWGRPWDQMVVEISGNTGTIISMPKPHDAKGGNYDWTAAAYYAGALSIPHTYLTDIKETDVPNKFSCKGHFWVGMTYYILDSAGYTIDTEPRGWLITLDAVITLSPGDLITVNLKNPEEGTLSDGWVQDTKGSVRELLGVWGADNSYYNTAKHYSVWPDGVDKSNIIGAFD